MFKVIIYSITTINFISWIIFNALCGGAVVYSLYHNDLYKASGVSS